MLTINNLCQGRFSVTPVFLCPSSGALFYFQLSKFLSSFDWIQWIVLWCNWRMYKLNSTSQPYMHIMQMLKKFTKLNIECIVLAISFWPISKQIIIIVVVVIIIMIFFWKRSFLPRYSSIGLDVAYMYQRWNHVLAFPTQRWIIWSTQTLNYRTLLHQLKIPIFRYALIL